MDDREQVEIQMAQPGKRLPRIFSTMVSCPCEWKQEGLGLDDDSPPVPMGSVGMWYVLTAISPHCPFHLELIDFRAEN